MLRKKVKKKPLIKECLNNILNNKKSSFQFNDSIQAITKIHLF